MGVEQAYAMTPLEVAIGMPMGYEGLPVRFPGRPSSPRVVLERVIRAAMTRQPCGVAFSGGRDSALILAVATHVARREGLPDPVPVTKVFPAAPETEEGEWQESLIRHLGLEHWERVVLHDELDLIGPIAQRHLLRHGVLWATVAHANVPLYEALPGGSMLDGEGGDDVLDDQAHRVGALWDCARARGRHSRKRAALSLAPRRVRAWLAASRAPEVPMPWLSDGVRETMEHEVQQEEIGLPLPFGRSVRLLPTMRSWVLAERTERSVAAEHGVEPVSPLMNAEFVDAVARERWLLGRGTRSDYLRHLAGDVLPAAVIERASKATFNDAYWAGHTQEFVRAWNGGGLSVDLVDVEVLRRQWQSGDSHMMTFGLLQQAWLASSGNHSV